MEQKWCDACSKFKSTDDFYKHHRYGFQNVCKLCKASYNRLHYINNRNSYIINANKRRASSQYKEARLKEKYGITLEEYELRLTNQEGKCKICGIKTDKKLVVDHDHVSGAVRGLLCTYCNRGLGFFRDTVSNLIAAAEYIGSRSGTS